MQRSLLLIKWSGLRVICLISSSLMTLIPSSPAECSLSRYSHLRGATFAAALDLETWIVVSLLSTGKAARCHVFLLTACPDVWVGVDFICWYILLFILIYFPQSVAHRCTSSIYFFGFSYYVCMVTTQYFVKWIIIYGFFLFSFLIFLCSHFLACFQVLCILLSLLMTLLWMYLFHFWQVFWAEFALFLCRFNPA